MAGGGGEKEIGRWREKKGREEMGENGSEWVEGGRRRRRGMVGEERGRGVGIVLWLQCCYRR